MVSPVRAPERPRTGPATLAYDPSNPAFHVDPYPLYARLREEAPLHRSPTDVPAWVVTRYADCLELLRRSEVGLPLDLDPQAGVRGGGPRSLARRAGQDARLRRLVAEAVTPWTLQRLRPVAEERVACLLEAARAQEALDLMQHLAEPVAVGLVCELLDIPAGERSLLREWLPALAPGRGLDATPAPERRRTELARQGCAAYLARRVGADERTPGGGLLMRLAGAGEPGDRLDQPERVALSLQLALAGYVMTRSLIGNLALALLLHRDALRAVQADPCAIPYAVDECLRWDSPLQLGTRVVVRPIELRGRRLRPGERLWLLIGAANRDPRSFREPDRFDPLRTGAPHLLSGFGGPVGVGTELARMGAEVALGGLVRRIPRLVLGSDDLDRRPSSWLRSPERLPVAIAH